MIGSFSDFLQRHPWLINVTGVVFLLLSPIVMPLMVLWENKHDVIQYYKDCFEAMFNK